MKNFDGKDYFLEKLILWMRWRSFSKIVWVYFLQTWFEFSPKILFFLPGVALSQVAFEFSTLALKPCLEFRGLVINSNSHLDNYLCAYLSYLCLLFFVLFSVLSSQLSKYMRHNNYTPRSREKPLPLGEENP